MRTFFAAAIALLVTASPLGAAPCPGFTLVSARSTVGTNPTRIAAADFNGDGKKDIVVANLNGSTVSVLFGNGDGTFGTRTNLTAGSGPDGVTVGDFDKDGDIDIAASVASGNYVSVFLNKGNGTFATRVRYFLPSGTESAGAITAADVNNDNKLDLVVSYADFAVVDGVAVMLGNGDGTFAAATELPSGGAGPRDVATGDFNGDGKLDIVSANDGTGTDSLSVYLGNGDGTFGAATNYTGVVDPFRVTAADVDGDGKVDIISAQHGPDDGDIAVLKGNGSGAFAAPVHYASGNLYDLTLADFDSDGKLDAASPSVDYNQTFVHPGLAGGAFGTAATYLSGPAATIFYPYGIAAVDLNGDGSLDLAVANYNNNDVSVLINNCTTQPSISTVAPAGGTTAGGTNVVLTGANLSGATSVKFGGTAATITANTSTTINVTTPAHAAGAVDVVAIVTTGTATKTNGFTYADPPTVSSINPTSGPAAGGQTGVVITGTNLSSVTNVKLGGTNATITNTTATTVTITTPAHAAGTVDVVLTNPAGSATLTNGYTYIAAPTVTSVSPNAGPTAGGQTGVLVNGTNFTGATNVTFGGTAATVTNITATQITVTTPAHAAGSVAVAVTTPGGTGTQNNAYTYAAAPTATTVTPNSGPTAGGQTGVAIAGTGLTTASSVTFDGLAATITNKTSTSVTVTTPAHAAGAVNVVVTTGGGSATITNGYTYVEAPTLASVSPNAGPTAGGQTGVVLTGTNLTGATQVRFGTTSATITNVTATTVTVTTPARAAGTVNVSVTTPGGTATANNAYTYVSAPTATGVAPNSGPAVGGQTSVVISGTNLSNATGVTFGGIAATITANGSTSVTVTTPAHAAGAVNVVVTTAGGSATRTNGYTYIDAPSISSLSPASGPVNGGQTVIINGSALSNASSVKLDGLTATITNNTAGTITVTTPQHAAPGAVSVVVTTPGGTGSSTYTYLAGSATHFSVVAPATATAGSPFSTTVTALDAFENVATGYAGTVHFTSSDGTATLPADSALTNGVGTFNATLRTVGAQSIAAADGAITGSTSINVVAGPAAVLDATAPTNATAGAPYSVTVTISDAFGNRITSYAGTVHFTATDAAATLPADSPVGGGQQSFSVTMRTAGAQTVTVTDGTLTDSATTTVAPGPTASFLVTGPSAATAGAPLAFAVTAKDAFNNTTPAYAGTVHFTSSDATTTLPTDSTLTNGTASFNATLRIAGAQSITATDNAIAGSLPVNVSPAAVSQLIVNAPPNATAGVPIAFTVTARDAFNNIATGYAATLHFTSTDGNATRPADSTLTNGTASFNATLRTTGTQTITASDGTLSGNASIQVGAATATHFTVSAPATTIAGNPLSVTVTARDAFENVVTGYAGTVHFTSSDPNATLPTDSTLTNGSATFSATLRTIGARTITAADG
ncbi:MAG: IPT/TIG domain-containing protein, partial [Acidobacteria bacterium]|nr:IPT/TIG domain-containing protein [Acidobacteriota bacterium]